MSETHAQAHYQGQEIVDVNEILKHTVEEKDKVYGRKNKPRYEDPSMFQILSWEDPKPEPWDFRTSKKEVLASSIANQIKYKLNKAGSPWVTETQDQFRKFQYSPDKEHPDKKKPVFIDLEGDAKHPERRVDVHGLIEEESVKSYNQAFYADQVNPKFLTETRAAYGMRSLDNEDEVRQYINGQELTKLDARKKTIQSAAEQKQAEEQQRAEEEEQARIEREQAEAEEERRRREEEEKVIIEKHDYKQTKSRLLQKKVKKARKLDPRYESDRIKRRKDRIKFMNETTRWLPNSAFMTYFGKPAFENYGKGNTNPVVGGVLYGDYLKTHNVNPHRGPSVPRYKQVFEHADFSSTRKPVIQPEPPRKCKDDFRLSQKQVEDLKKRNPLMPERFKEQLTTIVRPDLLNSLRFASEENTPEPSVDEGQKKPRKTLQETLKALQKTQRAIRQESAKKTQEKESTISYEKSDRRREDIPEKHTDFVRRLEESHKEATSPEPKDSLYARSRGQPEQGVLKQRETEITTQKAAQPDKKRATFAEPSEKLSVQSPQRQPLASPDQKASPTKQPRKALEEISVNQRPQTQQQKRPQESVADLIGFETKGSPQATQAQTQRPATSEGFRRTTQETTETSGKFDPLNPPKNYLFTLSEKEVNPRYYKNVPPVWTQRIPHAGKKNPQHEDIKNLFNYE